MSEAGPEPRASERRFVLALLATAGVALGAVAGFNALIDPYWVLGTPRVAGLNEHKPRVYLHMRMAKAHMVRRYQPQAVILGSSRTDQGLEPQHPGWRGRRTFNLGLAGANMREVQRWFEHARSVSPALEQAVLALDYSMFFDWQKAPDPNEWRLGRPGRAPPPFADWTTALLSRDALSDSRKTLRRQSQPGDERLHRADGMQSYDNVAARIRAKGGHRKIFRIVEHSLLTGELSRPPPELSARHLGAFRALLQQSREAGVQLAVLITPAHARDSDLLWRTGHWPRFEELKRELLRIRDAETAPGAVPFWDFSGYHPLNREPLPPEGDTETAMQWHWETAHFNAQLGNLVLDRVLDYRDPARPAVSDFGVQLSAANIEAHLREQRRAGAAYRRAQAAALAQWSGSPPQL